MPLNIRTEQGISGYVARCVELPDIFGVGDTKEEARLACVAEMHAAGYAGWTAHYES